MRGPQHTSVAIVAFLLTVGFSAMFGEPAVADDLTELSLEQLMNLEVVSVSRKPQRLAKSAAAVYVITQDDIRRSGVTSLPEALRLAPGIQVARLDGNKWAISSRGFNGRFANKLLVLIDGRTVYTPLFSGVYWDVQDMLLEDIDRIEIIRGPGATLWGANAVNGVINIITKSASETQGGLVTVGAGSEEELFGGFRYGEPLGENAFYRLYFKYADRDDSVEPDGSEAADAWDTLRGGFRVDWDASEADRLTLQGSIYDNDWGETVTRPLPAAPYAIRQSTDNESSGGHVLARWRRILVNDSELTLQTYYDRTDRASTILDESRDTVDFDVQHHIRIRGRHDVVWGVGYRHTRDDVDDSFELDLEPDSRSDNLFSAFLQDDISLLADADELHLILGTKLEHNDYTGFEIQPNARLAWNPNEKHHLWWSIARAVRTPSRAEADVTLVQSVMPAGASGPGSPHAKVVLQGNDDFESEELIAYEMGYRVSPTEAVSFDVAAFYNDYENLRTLEPGAPVPDPTAPASRVIVPFMGDNRMEGAAHGLEVAADWRMLAWWAWKLSYSYLDLNLKTQDSLDTRSELAEGESPENQFTLRALLDPTARTEFDAILRYVDNLPSLDIPSYLTLDLRFAWRASEDLELSIVGQNLFDSQHPEFSSLLVDTVATEVERGVYGKATWTF